MEKEKLAYFDNHNGIWEGGEISKDRPLDRKQWLEEVFPEWGHYLNKQIENVNVPAGKVSMWWLGGPSWILKTSENQIFLIDNYAGPSTYTTINACGVCRSSGAEELIWLRLNPQLIDPWAFRRVDAVFCTHHHNDHCDIYTVKATNQTTQCRFVGPERCTQLMKSWGIKEERIDTVKIGDVLEFGNTKVHVLFNYDEIASITGVNSPSEAYNKYEIAVSYLFDTPGGNILFLGDSLYFDGYRIIKEKFDIDVVILDMGHNAPGVTDKMTPFDVFRVGQAVGAKVIIPDHYDNWANSQINPWQLVKIVEENDPSIKVVIMQWGGMFTYPDDKDMKFYKYPDWRERFRPEQSWKYGELAKKINK